jgi:hypothetical protein
LNIEMKRRKRPSVVEACENILKKLGYNFIQTVKSDEVWLKK